MTRSHRSKRRGALLGALVGDALGAPLEGHPVPVPAACLAEIEREARPRRYTDDSAMTMALAESLLARHDLDQDHLAHTFAAHYAREPRRGYGAGAADLLGRVAAGADWREAAAAQFGGRGSFGNGAAMRVAPVALHAAGDLHRVVGLARGSAVVTHTHPAAVEGAAAQAVAVALALAQPPSSPLDRRTFLARVTTSISSGEMAEALRSLPAVLDQRPAPSPEVVAARIGTGVTAVEAVPAALAAFLLHPGSFPEAVRFAVLLGGDTDTIASMAGALAGAYLGESAIPAAWLDATEGVDRMLQLADRLCQPAS